jgi:co-chaperonin GroES (HSP10)
MAWDDLHPYQPEIVADIERLRPLGDFILVKPLPEDQTAEITDSKLQTRMVSEFTMTRDGRYRWNRAKGLIYGVAVACGKGDRLFWVGCDKCGLYDTRLAHRIGSRCAFGAVGKRCEGRTRIVDHEDRPVVGHADMDVKPGDIVIVSRVPANEIRINGEEYGFFHLEQHVLGIVEQEKIAA